MRGSHQMPLMAVLLNSGISYFDGPPVVTCAAFGHPFWGKVRDQVSAKAMEMRRQGFFGAAMLPMSEPEYTGIMEKLDVLNTRFKVRD